MRKRKGCYNTINLSYFPSPTIVKSSSKILSVPLSVLKLTPLVLLCSTNFEIFEISFLKDELLLSKINFLTPSIPISSP